MWVIENNQQFFSFLVALISGAIYCSFYDLFRAYRYVIKCRTLSVFFQDIFFWLTVALSTFLLMLSLCGGEIRAFMILGQLSGFVICRITVSRILLAVLVFLLKRIVLLLKLIIRVKNAVKIRILSVFSKVCRKLAKKVKNIGKYFKKPLETGD